MNAAIIILIFFCVLPFFYLHQGLFSVDTGREFYIAQQINDGAVLYKDILNIYPPLSYQINAVLFKLSGEKISVLYIAGVLNSLVILLTLYFLSKEFLSRRFSFLITLAVMFALVFRPYLFNSNITYSYGIIYALSAFLISLLMLVKYTKNAKPGYAYISCFFAALSLLNKYEFILYPAVIIYVLCFLKPLGIKNFLKADACFFAPVCVSFGVLFIQGLNFQDLSNAFNIMYNLASSDNMKIFYAAHGNYFEPAAFIRLLKSLNPVSIILGFMPVINIALSASFLLTPSPLAGEGRGEGYGCNEKGTNPRGGGLQIYENKPLFILCLASVAAAAKFTLFLNMEHMGVFVFPICLLMFILMLDRVKDGIKYAFLLILIIFYAYTDFAGLKDKTYLLETKKGSIYTYYKDRLMIKTASDFIFEHTKKTDKIAVFPEGAFVNFITDRKADNQYLNLDPLYYNGAFDKNAVIRHFSENPADYIIIMPLPLDEFDRADFCGYAAEFCKMIYENYDLVQNKNGIRIFGLNR